MKVAMILSGCGYLDGAEIRESVLSLLYLDQQGAKVDVYAPDSPQMHVINHQTGNEVKGERNVLEEAARISRGDVQKLDTLDMKNYDGLVIPGGFGVAKNLSDFASKGVDCEVLPAFKKAVQACVTQKKPLAAICIAPAVVAAALQGGVSPTVTIGEDKDVASAIESFGATHKNCASDACVVDEQNQIITCSAYMREDKISAIAKGIEKTIQVFAQKIAANKEQKAA